MVRIVRHRQPKGAANRYAGPDVTAPHLYSTHGVSLLYIYICGLMVHGVSLLYIHIWGCRAQVILYPGAGLPCMK